MTDPQSLNINIDTTPTPTSSPITFQTTHQDHDRTHIIILISIFGCCCCTVIIITIKCFVQHDKNYTRLARKLEIGTISKTYQPGQSPTGTPIDDIEVEGKHNQIDSPSQIQPARSLSPPTDSNTNMDQVVELVQRHVQQNEWFTHMQRPPPDLQGIHHLESLGNLSDMQLIHERTVTITLSHDISTPL